VCQIESFIGQDQVGVDVVTDDPDAPFEFHDCTATAKAFNRQDAKSAKEIKNKTRRLLMPFVFLGVLGVLAVKNVVLNSKTPAGR
jgi:hypothetical protein